MHHNIPAAVLLACSCAVGNVSSQAASQHAAPGAPAVSGMVGKDHDTTISNAIAGPLIDAISDQLGDRAVDMRLDTVDVQAINAGDRAVSGTGGVQIDGKGGWVGFRFRLLYNSRLRRAGYPEVSIGGVAAGEHDVPNDARLVQQLEAVVSAALAHEFRTPSASLHLDRIATVEGGSRFLRINAEGVAYLGRDGRDGRGTPLTIEALYDRSNDSWPRLAYGLGDDAGAPP